MERNRDPTMYQVCRTGQISSSTEWSEASLSLRAMFTLIRGGLLNSTSCLTSCPYHDSPYTFDSSSFQVMRRDAIYRGLGPVCWSPRTWKRLHLDLFSKLLAILTNWLTKWANHEIFSEIAKVSYEARRNNVISQVSLP